MTLSPMAVAFLTLFALGAAVPLAAESPPDDAHAHVRMTDKRLHRLVHEGLRDSDTFRGLVARLEQSDVVVYFECDLAMRPAGRLTFVSAVAGVRYLHVRLSRLGSREQQIALIAHELRHAVEIADAPEVVDVASLGAAYERIGYVNHGVATPGVAFDSEAAVRTGYQVLRELSGRQPSGPGLLAAVKVTR
jgi:hypothetical protein